MECERIGQHDHPAAGRLVVYQAHRCIRVAFPEQPLATANHDGIHKELILIDEVVLDQRLRQPGTAGDKDVFARLRLELRNFPATSRLMIVVPFHIASLSFDVVETTYFGL